MSFSFLEESQELSELSCRLSADAAIWPVGPGSGVFFDDVNGLSDLLGPLCRLLLLPADGRFTLAKPELTGVNALAFTEVNADVFPGVDTDEASGIGLS
jgi:hypothetical protein